METIEKIKWLNRGIALGKKCRILTDGKRGQGSKTAEIYCGDEFLLWTLGELGLNAECEIYTVEVKL